ncbi:hypothetical protein ACQKLP_09150 [Chitinophaga sp. NPDC101104]|uniref:hypothetical protein n=1 Tax=Chitinophaga sp. NPDC101104 TaxID=3390561 RepID=UPI003D07CD3B
MLSRSDVSLFLRAWPEILRPDALAIGKHLSGILESDRAIFEYDHPMFSLDGEQVQIPARIYCREPDFDAEMPQFTETQLRIYHCTFLRNHDGFVRQRALAALDKDLDYWMIPFVLQLLGEYVIEIIQDLDAYITGGNMTTFARFVKENPAYWRLTEDRIGSYWVYYRDRFPDIRQYPARMIANRINAAL